jgi:hypothetical protein
MAFLLRRAAMAAARAASGQSRRVLRPPPGAAGAALLSTSSGSGGDATVYTGNKLVPLVSTMQFVRPAELPTYPALRILDDAGQVVPGAEAADPHLTKEECLYIYRTMIRLYNMDVVFYQVTTCGRDEARGQARRE